MRTLNVNVEIMNYKRAIVKAASIMAFNTLLSRVLGLVRDMASASLFGATNVFDSFVVGFRIPNLFRRLFGEGALNGAVVPVFSELLYKEEDKRHSKELFHSLSTAISLWLGVITIIVSSGCIAARFWFPSHSLTLNLTAIMMPYMPIICICGFFMGILNCLGHFSVPALSPAVFNGVLIFFLYVICPRVSKDPVISVYVLSAGVIAGGIVQLAMHLWVLRRMGFSPRPQLRLHPKVKEILMIMGPAVAGLSINQINTLVDSMLALIIGPGAASALYYGNRLIEFPLGVLGIAISTAVLPLMSRQTAEGRSKEFKELVSYSLRISTFFMLPATIGLIQLRTPIVQAVYERGSFDAASTSATASALMFYSIGLCAYVWTKLLTQCYYSIKKIRETVRVGIIMVIVNFLLNLCLMKPMKASGLAFATSICAFLNTLILAVKLKPYIGNMPMRELLASFSKTCASCIFMSLSMAAAGMITHGWRPFATLLAIVPVGVLSYCLAGFLIKSPEMREAVKSLLTNRK